MTEVNIFVQKDKNKNKIFCNISYYNYNKKAIMLVFIRF